MSARSFSTKRRRPFCGLLAALWPLLAVGVARAEPAAPSSPAASPAKVVVKKAAAPPPAGHGILRLLPAPRTRLGRRDPFRPDQPVTVTQASAAPGLPGRPAPTGSELPAPPPLPGASPAPLPPAPSLPPRPISDMGVAPETPAPIIPSVQLRFTGMIMMPAEPPVALIEVTNGREIQYVSAVQGDRVLQSYRLISANLKRIILLRRQDNYRLTLVIDQPVMLRP